MVAHTQSVPPPSSGKRTSLRFDLSQPISQPTPVQKTNLSTQEVATLLGWSDGRVLNAAKAGKIPAHYSGNRPRFYRPEIERWQRGESGLPVVGDSQEEIEAKLKAYAPIMNALMAWQLAQIERYLAEIKAMLGQNETPAG